MAKENMTSNSQSTAAAAVGAPARASDIMTTPVISVAPDASVGDVARLLLENAISAVPVMDQSGELIGMVSDGDLLGRGEHDRLARRDWWLTMLTDQGKQETVLTADQQARAVNEVMHAPVITIDADAPIGAVADMLTTHRIKRLPVTRDGRVVGIVSRADVLRAATMILTPAQTPRQAAGGLVGVITNLMGGEKHARGSTASQSTPPIPVAHVRPSTAEDFRGLVQASNRAAMNEKQRAAQEADLARHRQVKTLLQAHLDAEMWESLLTHARAAAAQGATEFQLLRFPSELSRDGGRRIDVGEEGWEATLRGEAADLYDRWERELKPAGFRLSARILEYPHGKLGDIGLFLVWGE